MKIHSLNKIRKKEAVNKCVTIFMCMPHRGFGTADKLATTGFIFPVIKYTVHIASAMQYYMSLPRN